MCSEGRTDTRRRRPGRGALAKAGASLPLPTAASFLSGASIALELPNHRQPPRKTREAEAGVGTPSKQNAGGARSAGTRPLPPQRNEGA